MIGGGLVYIGVIVGGTCRGGGGSIVVLLVNCDVDLVVLSCSFHVFVFVV